MFDVLIMPNIFISDEIIRLSDSCFEFTFKVMRNLSKSRLGEEIEISYCAI